MLVIEESLKQGLIWELITMATLLEEEHSDLGGKRLTKKSVSFVDDEKVKPKQTTQLDIMKSELEKMRRRDEEMERRAKEHRRMEVEKLKAQYHKERLEKGIQLYPGVAESKNLIADKIYQEVKHAMQEERMKLAAETSRLKNEISLKYGLHIKKKSQNLVKMAEDFISPAKASNDYGLPDRIVRELTHQEMKDLKQIFDLFDVAGTGYIRPTDVLKISNILGFRGKKDVFKTLIDDLTKDHRGRVTFITFLDFLVKQQQGMDPFDEVVQCFRMLDRQNKGYLTFADLRRAADDVDCKLSNGMIREMVEEADTSGNGHISLDEFTIIMLRTSAFKTGV